MENEIKYVELRTALLEEGNKHMNAEPGTKEQQDAFNNVLAGTKLLAEIENKDAERQHQAEEAKKERKHNKIVTGVKIVAEVATTAAIMAFTAAENKKSRIFETSADYVSSVSKSTNKLVQGIGEGLKNLIGKKH